MFYNSGEVISDQYNHLILIQNLENSEKNRRKQEVLGFFFLPIPKSICQNSDQKLNILMKTKNAPNDLKCKINHICFFH